jgi:hypothetical protein
MSQRRRDSCLRRLGVIAGVLIALGVAAPSASAVIYPAAFGPPLPRFTQDMSQPTQTAVGDFDQTGADLDIVAVSLNGQPGDDPNDIALMRGQGNGLFDAATGINTTDGLNRVVVGEFNGDNDPDLAVSLRFGNQVLIYTGAAGMTFNAATPITLSGANARRSESQSATSTATTTRTWPWRTTPKTRSRSRPAAPARPSTPRCRSRSGPGRSTLLPGTSTATPTPTSRSRTSASTGSRS